MFEMMNNARLAVGLQGVSIADYSYQKALSYCNDRVQGIAPGYNETGPIIRHPDVKRMIRLMQVLTDGARSLTYYACAELDPKEKQLSNENNEIHKRRVALLTPLVKAWCTEVAQEVVSLCIQCHGGAGFIEETGAGQLFRDARILPIYEGTNGIQSMDLVFRKLLGDDGLAIKELTKEMLMIDEEATTTFLSAKQTQSFIQAVDELMIISGSMLNNRKNKSLLAGIAFDFLMMTSIIAANWRLIESATYASKDSIKSKYSQEFLGDRLSSAGKFIDNVLPRYQMHRSIILNQLDN